MSQFMIVAVTKSPQEGKYNQEIALLDGKFGFKDNKFNIWKAVQYATGNENPFHGEVDTTILYEDGLKFGDMVLDKPYTFIWGTSKREIIEKFLNHDFEPLF